MNAPNVTLHVVGHTKAHPDGVIGEVGSARKTLDAARLVGLPSVGHDVHDIGAPFDLLNKIGTDIQKKGTFQTNPPRSTPQGVKLNDDIQMTTRPGSQPVTFAITYPHALRAFHELGLVSGPTITRFYSESADANAWSLPYHRNVIGVMHPFGALNLIKKGIEPDRIFWHHHSYPEFIDKLHTEKKTTSQKQDFLRTISQIMQEQKVTRTAKKPPAEPVIFLSAVRHIPEKNVLESIKAFREVAKTNPNAVLVLRDDATWRSNDQRQQFEQLIAEIKDEPWFFWDKRPGRIEPKELMAQHFAHSDVIIDTTGVGEFNNVRIEGAAMGKPVVSLRTTEDSPLNAINLTIQRQGTKQITDPHKMTVYLPHHDQLVAILKKLSTDATFRKTEGARARKNAELLFSPQRLGNKLQLAAQAAYLHHTTGNTGEAGKKLKAELEKEMKAFGLYDEYKKRLTK